MYSNCLTCQSLHNRRDTSICRKCDKTLRSNKARNSAMNILPITNFAYKAEKKKGTFKRNGYFNKLKKVNE